jgi:tRNA (guanine10-N2)-methyltransferase
VARTILSKAIYELWGEGDSYLSLHDNVRERSMAQWAIYKQSTFNFQFDSYQGKRTLTYQQDIIKSFRYLGFEGKIRLKKAEEEYCVFEEWDYSDQIHGEAHEPKKLYLGRLVGKGSRDLMGVYDLKKRCYISTTSMDSELALVTANLTCAAPGKIFYDPFTGTGSFPIACSHFGAYTYGSDIDGRSIRGKGKDRTLFGNFKQYGLTDVFLDSFIADLTNSPLREGTRLFDGIVCDPPYGVREGLKVLGSRDTTRIQERGLVNGLPRYK